MTLTIDKAIVAIRWLFLRWTPRRREALITLLPVLPELEKRRRAWVGWGVLEWCFGFWRCGSWKKGERPRLDQIWTISIIKPEEQIS